MNIATFLINTSLFFIVFILCGLLARSIYRRRVVTPHRRQIEALVNDCVRIWGDQARTIVEAKQESARLKQNYHHLADRYNRIHRKMEAYRECTHTALVRIRELEAQLEKRVVRQAKKLTH